MSARSVVPLVLALVSVPVASTLLADNTPASHLRRSIYYDELTNTSVMNADGIDDERVN